MDLVLTIADEYLLDSLYAKLIPLSFFNPVENATVAAASTLPVGLLNSKWAQFIPHPPVFEVLSQYPDYELSSFESSSLSAWPRSYILRQMVSLLALTLIGVHVLYFFFGSLSYYFVFDHDIMKHPKFLKNQVKQEIHTSLKSFPAMIVLALPWFLGDVRGYTRLYGGVDGPWEWAYLILSAPAFLLFTDYCIYWVHRSLHLPIFYKHLHKPHHKWLVPTPFASHAFHPVDGSAHSIPYHLYIYLFPMHRVLYLVMFLFVNVWTIFIHDSDMATGFPLETLINGPAHHTLHHLFFSVNYGQYFTWADKAGGTYLQPESSLDPLLDIKASEKTKKVKAE